MNTSNNKLLGELLEALQIKSIEVLLEELGKDEVHPRFIELADTICKRHGIQFDPAVLKTQLQPLSRTLPFTSADQVSNYA